MALKITMFSDFICPFCYIGFEVIQKLKREFRIDLEWRSFEIHPEWPADGIAAEKLRSAGDMDTRKAAWSRIVSMADSEGLVINTPALLINSHKALLLAEFAKDRGRSDEFDGRVYRAYFVDGANIGDNAVLTQLAADAGLDRDEALAALGSQNYETRLKNNALAAHQRQITGVPTFMFGEYPVVGAQTSDVMRMIIRRASERVIATA